MSRDFIIHFNLNNKDKINESFEILKNIYIIDKDIKKIKDRKKIRAFEVIEKRDKSIFISLTYPNDLKNDNYFVEENKKTIKCSSNVNFVAIKNEIHDSTGYLFTNIKDFDLNENMHVKKIYNLISSF